MKSNENSINALLLSAGYGTRLRPLTNNIPKCLVPIQGKPLMGYWLENLDQINCKNICINTHYRSDQVNEFVNLWNMKSRKSSAQIYMSHEKKLLGTAGTLLANYELLSTSQRLLVAHADNATTLDLNKLVKAHQQRSPECCITMLTFRTENPSSCGIVELDSKNVVVGFQEKHISPNGNLANGAVYIFEREALDTIRREYSSSEDISNDIIPKFMGKIQSWETHELFLDIGTPETLHKAQQLWPCQ